MMQTILYIIQNFLIIDGHHVERKNNYTTTINNQNFNNQANFEFTSPSSQDLTHRNNKGWYLFIKKYWRITNKKLVQNPRNYYTKILSYLPLVAVTGIPFSDKLLPSYLSSITAGHTTSFHCHLHETCHITNSLTRNIYINLTWKTRDFGSNTNTKWLLVGNGKK